MRYRWLTVLALLACLDARPARAQPTGGVIESGREEEVLALFAPHRMGEPVARGHRMGSVRIQRERIVVELVPTAGEPFDALVLRSAADAPKGARTHGSFWLERSEGLSADARAAVQALEAAVRANDPGGLFTKVPDDEGPDREPDTVPLWLGIAALLAAAGGWDLWRRARRRVTRDRS